MPPLNEGPWFTSRSDAAPGFVRCPLFMPEDHTREGGPRELWNEAMMPRCATLRAVGPCCGKCAQAFGPAEGSREGITPDLVAEMDEILRRRIAARAAIVPTPPARPKPRTDGEGPQLSMFEAWRK